MTRLRLLTFGLDHERNALVTFGQDGHALLKDSVACEKITLCDHLIAGRAPDCAQSTVDRSTALVREAGASGDLADCSFPRHL